MIFSSNTTQLGDFSSKFAVDANYTASYGSALALVESAKTDYQMFRAMLNADAVEMGLKKNGGYLAESQIVSLQEATIKEIWNKIVEAFKKLGEKIKSLFTAFITKLSGLFMNDAKLAKKYKADLTKKSKSINANVSVKWITPKKDVETITQGCSGNITAILDACMDPSDIVSAYKSDADARKDYFMGNAGKFKDFDKNYNKEYFGAEKPEAVEKKIGDIGGIVSICNFMETSGKLVATLKNDLNTMLKAIDGLVKSYKSYASGQKKISKRSDADKDDKDDAKDASKTYEMTQAGQAVANKVNGWLMSAIKMYVKQNKAALLKAIAYLGKAKSNDKDTNAASGETTPTGGAADAAEATGPAEATEESFLYMIGECAEQEVDDVIDAAIPDSEIDELNSATTNVLDADTTDDPDKLTYGPDQYTPNLTTGISGTIDTNIDSKEESAFFGKLFY